MRISPVVAIGGMLSIGTMTSLLAKIIYGVRGVGIDGREREFRKPLFETFSMFVGMAVCKLLDWWTMQQAFEDEIAHHKLERLEHEQRQQRNERSPRIILVPAVFDLVATCLMCTGLLFAPVSVYQMLRGSMLVFCAIFSVTLLKRELHIYNYIGVGCAIVGIVMVGTASVLGEPSHESQAKLLLGIALMVAGQCAQALQVVAEEHLLHQLEMPAMRVVAYEGWYGILMFVFIVFPLAYFLPGFDFDGSWENTLDSLVMIKNSTPLIAILLLDAVCMLFFNLFSLNVTLLSSAMFRTILETMRTLFVWLIDLWLFYGPTHGRFGERWTPYSWTQVLGFVVIVAGTFVYGKQPVKISPEADGTEEETAPMVTEVDDASKAASDGLKRRGSSYYYGAVVREEDGGTSASSAAGSPGAAAAMSRPRRMRGTEEGVAAAHSYGTSPAYFMRHGGFSPAVYVGSPLPHHMMRAAETPSAGLHRRNSRTSSGETDEEAGVERGKVAASAPTTG